MRTKTPFLSIFMLFKIALKGVTSSKELAELSRITPKSTRSDLTGPSYMDPNIEQPYGGKENFELKNSIFWMIAHLKELLNLSRLTPKSAQPDLIGPNYEPWKLKNHKLKTQNWKKTLKMETYLLKIRTYFATFRNFLNLF